ncbi:MAG TPA: NAD(P)H-flavin reductase [Idiomarina abyssalis]|jgi:aquacobalamin reductase/NAD(P)H-flavin reductase|uniref:NAD(P)H-flavin reductase n=1 Tax=Idiomarina TaxID=135575 RepID=UPI000C5E44A0|nr:MULTISPECIES: NAD(P)H-flavin reductase [Idiomarina]MAB22719.1 NAD(P)H-flavin reductase [Idiomarina sp.]MBH93223.1 NAD(P)H-flavin reductase [Idiomarina sp.]HAS15979.1 NAD(P)H-flavin reductase [Idiomarina abyssalis]|tara:strand:- start:753 stop:1454 length:702 start_codon:yes stop_codon:yes gene_type:complete
MSQQMTCKADISRQLADAVWEVRLQLPQPVEFKAGQYLMVVMGERDKRPFSIASCPSDKSEWLLHVGATPDNSYAMEVLDKVRADGELEIDAPDGSAFYRQESTQPAVLIAGGTGFSYAYSILQQHLRLSPERSLSLYWGAKSLSDLYLHDKLESLAEQYENFDYHPVVEDASGDWPYSIGLVHHAVMARQKNLSDCEVYMAGRFEMVRVIRDDFVAKGVPLDNLYGDALSFI